MITIFLTAHCYVIAWVRQLIFLHLARTPCIYFWLIGTLMLTLHSLRTQITVLNLAKDQWFVG